MGTFSTKHGRTKSDRTTAISRLLATPNAGSGISGAAAKRGSVAPTSMAGSAPGTGNWLGRSGRRGTPRAATPSLGQGKGKGKGKGQGKGQGQGQGGGQGGV